MSAESPGLLFLGNSVFHRKRLSGAYLTSLRNRFQERCKKVVRRSKRRIGRSCCRRASAESEEAGAESARRFQRSLLAAALHISFAVAAIRRLTRKTSSRVFSSIYSNTTRLSRADQERGPIAHVLAGVVAKFSA